MNSGPSPSARCGLDTVELARIDRLLIETAPADLQRLFWPAELKDAGQGSQRTARLAGRFAAKEACCKLFPAKPRWEPLDQLTLASTAMPMAHRP